MSAEIVNLRQYRKQKSKAAKDLAAAANRRRHGRIKGERLADKDGEARQARDLDGKQLETDID
ncbi:MAG: DUF4169 family protein [Rhodospirillaceae bacterium]